MSSDCTAHTAVSAFAPPESVFTTKFCACVTARKCARNVNARKSARMTSASRTFHYVDVSMPCSSPFTNPVLLWWCRTGRQYRSTGPPENPPPGRLASDNFDMVQLVRDIIGSLQCRNCETDCPPNAPLHYWDFMRVESPETSVVPLEEPGELTVKFECVNCESIAVPLPAKGLVPGGKRWSMDDRAVRFMFGSFHAWSKGGTAKRRATNQMTVQAHETRSPDSVDRAVHDVARARSLAQEGVVGGGAGFGEAGGDGEHARAGVQPGRTAAAASRAAKGKVPARNLANPLESESSTRRKGACIHVVRIINAVFCWGTVQWAGKGIGLLLPLIF